MTPLREDFEVSVRESGIHLVVGACGRHSEVRASLGLAPGPACCNRRHRRYDTAEIAQMAFDLPHQDGVGIK